MVNVCTQELVDGPVCKDGLIRQRGLCRKLCTITICLLDPSYRLPLLAINAVRSILDKYVHTDAMIMHACIFMEMYLYIEKCLFYFIFFAWRCQSECHKFFIRFAYVRAFMHSN